MIKEKGLILRDKISPDITKYSNLADKKYKINSNGMHRYDGMYTALPGRFEAYGV